MPRVRRESTIFPLPPSESESAVEPATSGVRKKSVRPPFNVVSPGSAAVARDMIAGLHLAATRPCGLATLRNGLTRRPLIRVPGKRLRHFCTTHEVGSEQALAAAPFTSGDSQEGCSNNDSQHGRLPKVASMALHVHVSLQELTPKWPPVAVVSGYAFSERI